MLCDAEENYNNFEGCEQLSKANWPHLTILNLTRRGYDDFMSKKHGCERLSEANWPHLAELHLGSCYVIQRKGL